MATYVPVGRRVISSVPHGTQFDGAGRETLVGTVQTHLLASRRGLHDATADDDDQISNGVCARFQTDLLNANRDVHELRTRFK